VVLMQYQRLRKGLKNSSATFQRIVNSVLGDMKGQTVSVFVDDVFVGTECAAERLVVLREDLERIRDSGMKLRLPKFHFGKRSIEILGHQVIHMGILPSEGHLSAVKNLMERKNAEEFMRFLGLANYFKELLEDFSHRTKPLYYILRGMNVNKKK
jgi:hypothetical protein